MNEMQKSAQLHILSGVTMAIGSVCLVPVNTLLNVHVNVMESRVRMKVPRLEIYLNQETDLCIAKVEHENAESRVIVDVAVDELKALGSENAAHRIGGTVLNILGLWHKQVFENLEVPPVIETKQCDDDYSVALRLIDHALSTKSVAHNASIELLLQQAAIGSEDARTYLEDAWPLLRSRLGTP